VTGQVIRVDGGIII